MAVFQLTILANNFSGGGTVNDVFTGPGGGNDVLSGGAGNDRFEIDEFQRGIISGGIGLDKIVLDNMSNQLHTGLSINGVEELSINFQNLYAKVAQLAGFTKITVNTVQPEFFFFLQGAGGALDLSTSYTSLKKLNVEAAMTTSAVTILGTARGDSILGSDFADTLTGGAGFDQLNGGAGADKLNGGLGKDTLTGGLAADLFIFSAKTHSVVGANADRIMDFDDVNTGDRIDVSALFPTTMVYRHNLAFNAAGQVRINDVAGPDIIVEVNTGGTLAADFSIRLVDTTLASMNAGDFVL